MMPVSGKQMFLDEGHDSALSIETRHHSASRTERAQSIREDEGQVTVELASIMATASNPVSPGPSSPPLDQSRMQDFVPPTRPSSTPFPQPEPRSDDIQCRHCPFGDAMNLDVSHDKEPCTFHRQQPVGRNLNDLPAEIHECILDHLFGFRVSTLSKISITRWGTALRHSRRKELSEMALVSRIWKALIQKRLFRHIKLKATIDSLNDAFSYFAQYPHLKHCIKHLEVWFSVFQPKYGPLASRNLPLVTRDGITNPVYVLPSGNCSLEEVFYFMAETLPEVAVLTLEGGERKKAPKIQHWIHKNKYDDIGIYDAASASALSVTSKKAPSMPKRRSMPKVDSVRTLVCKSQWNLMRSLADFEVLMSALPNLTEWHALYSKPKSKSYLNMADVLSSRSLATGHLSAFQLCMENDYRREVTVPRYFTKVQDRLHFCIRLAMAASSWQLEHLSYTGRVCRHFFAELSARVQRAATAANDPNMTRDNFGSRLQSIDVTVKNCCRESAEWNETGSGICDFLFITAFEQLVLSAIQALKVLKRVQYLRIRYVDLDSPVPSLNPYFVLDNGWCSGAWSEAIVEELARVRPQAHFKFLEESLGVLGYNEEGRKTIRPIYPESKSLSMKLKNYEDFVGGIIQI